MEAASDMDFALFVGTSFAVGVTDLFLQGALEKGVRAYAIDPGARRAPHPHVTLLPERGEELLPEACRLLGIDWQMRC